MAKLDLKLHPKKTKIVSMWDGKEGFDFLGMHHRRMTTETSKGQLYKETYQYPSRKAMKKMKAEIKRNVNSRSLLVAKEEDLIKNLNPKITGWKNYYSTYCVDGVLCRTPEELFDLLLEDCLGFEEIQLTGGRRDPNHDDETVLEQLRQSYLAQYRKGEPK